MNRYYIGTEACAQRVPGACETSHISGDSANAASFYERPLPHYFG